MQGEAVKGWTANVGTALNLLDPAYDNVFF
jgi:hypothetical protein